MEIRRQVAWQDGLRHLRDKLGDRFKAGVLLYTGESTVPARRQVGRGPAMRTVGCLMSAIRASNRDNPLP